MNPSRQESHRDSDTSLGVGDPIESLVEEFLDRQRRGETPTIEDYATRYPELADRIRSLFPMMTVLEAFAPKKKAFPNRLGEFVLIQEIGRGGMGVVYEARQESLNRLVAVKILSTSALQDPQCLNRFQQEARTAALLHHTNIVPIFDIGEDQGLHFMAMQLIRGRGLDRILDQVRQDSDQPTVPVVANPRKQDRTLHPTPPPTPRSPSSHPLSVQYLQNRMGYDRSIAKLMAQAADALRYAHEHGVIHRDIKPGNLLLDDTGNVWLSDFGLARMEGNDALTQTGMVVGTPRYMAPERFDGYDLPAGDIYALGATFYELLALQPIFAGSERAELMMQIHAGKIAPLSQIRSDIPKDLETIVMKCLHRETVQRYTPEELVEDLRRFQNGETILARRPHPIRRLIRWSYRNPTVAGLIFALFVSLSTGLIVSLRYGQRAQENLEQAIQARSLAEDRLTDAVDVIEQSINAVNDTFLFDMPGTQPLQKEMLQTPIKYYQKYLEQNQENPSLKLGVAKAQLRLASVLSTFDDRTQAIQLYQKGLAYLEEIQAEQDSPTVRMEFGRVYMGLGIEHAIMHNFPESKTRFDQAQEVLEALVKEQPEDWDTIRLLAQVYRHLGQLFYSQNQYPQATAQWTLGRDLLKERIQLAPDPWQGFYLLALFENRLGNNVGLAKPKVGLAHQDQASQWIQQALQRRPYAVSIRRLACEIQVSRGRFLRLFGKLPEAQVAFETAERDMAQLCQLNPTFLLLQEYYVDLLNRLASLHAAKKEPEPAIRYALQSVRQAEELLTSTHNQRNMIRIQRDSLNTLAGVYVRFQKYKEAESLYQKIIPIVESNLSSATVSLFDQIFAASTYNMLGEIHRHRQNLIGALESFEKGLAITRLALEKHAKSESLQMTRKELHRQAGEVHWQLQHKAEARLQFRSALLLCDKKPIASIGLAKSICSTIPAEEGEDLFLELLQAFSQSQSPQWTLFQSDPIFAPYLQRPRIQSKWQKWTSQPIAKP